MKMFMLVLTMLVGASASAESFVCWGNTYDSYYRVEVRGRFSYGSMDSNLVIRRIDPSGYIETRYFGPEDVTIAPSTSSYFSLSANLHGYKILILRHPQYTSGQTYLRIYLDDGFDHEFSRASCRFQ